nr:hypothetical protein [Butyrivibrio sp.]
NPSATGTMEDQKTTYSWPEPLFANQFVCDGYEFVGWSRTAGGNVEFTDRQIIKDLSKIKDDVVSLYAVWTEKGVSKNYWTANWDWAPDHSYATLYLTNVNNGSTVTFKVDSTSTTTKIGTDTRTTYFVECTFNGEKYTDSYTTINGEEVTTDAFSYTGVDGPYTYTGKAIKLDDLKVYWGESILVEGTDYSLKYKNNINAGIATVTIAGKGQFDKAFDETIPFVIEQADISGDDFAVDNPVILDTAKVADPKLMFGKAAVNKKLYTVRYSEGAVTKQIPVAGQKAPADVYTGTIEPLPGGNFTGEREFTLTVIKSGEAISASKLKVKFDKTTAIKQEQVDSADGYIPTFTVSNGKDKVTSDNNTKSAKEATFDDLFTVEYLNNHSAGTATVIITAADGCELGGKKVVGSIKKTFNIPGAKFSKEQKKAFNAIKNKTVPYTGYAYDLEGVLNALCEETHIYNPYEYVPGLEYERDWNVSAYAKNIKKGTMTITITGSGIYKDTVKVPVKIGAYTDYAVSFDGLIDSNYVPSAGDPNDPENEPFRTPNEVSYKAGGTTVTGLTVRALDGDYFLREGVDYTVSYENNKMLYSDAKNKKKVAYLVIKGKGNYGTKKIAFTVVPNDFNEYSLYVVPNEILEKQKVATATAISNGKAKAPAVYDAVTGKKLTAGKDFGFRYEDFDPATSSFPVVITGLNSTYCGEAVFAGYHVYGAKLVGSGKKANIALSPMLKKYYTGKPITLDAYDFDWTPDKAQYGEDFEIIGYKNNIKAGNASVTVKAIGDRFGGTVTLKFKINKAKKIEN